MVFERLFSNKLRGKLFQYKIVFPLSDSMLALHNMIDLPLKDSLPKILKSLELDEIEAVKKFHILQKKRFDSFMKFINKNFRDEFIGYNISRSKIQQSCLELAVIYYYFFDYVISEDEKFKILGYYYFWPLFDNFRNLQRTIRVDFNDESTSLDDFFKIKSKYFHESVTSDNRERYFSEYYYILMIHLPLRNFKPETQFNVETDSKKYLLFKLYLNEIVSEIWTEAKEFEKTIKNLKLE